MAYRLSNKGKGDWPTEEEEQVLTALSAYTFDMERATPQDFVPLGVLYEKYKAYVTGIIGASVLSHAQFGVALRRVFDLHPDRKTQRRVAGKPVKGYAGVRGPGSVIGRQGPGNPKWAKQ